MCPKQRGKIYFHFLCSFYPGSGGGVNLLVEHIDDLFDYLATLLLCKESLWVPHIRYHPFHEAVTKGLCSLPGSAWVSSHDLFEAAREAATQDRKRHTTSFAAENICTEHCTTQVQQERN